MITVNAVCRRLANPVLFFTKNTGPSWLVSRTVDENILLPTGAIQGCVGAGDDAGAVARSDWHGAGRALSQRLEGGANCATLCADERHLSKHSLEW